MKQRHFSMLRDFHLADWFTLANAFCGTGAVFASMRFLQDGNVRYLLIGMALIPLSFGVAPAALAYACGLQGGWDWIVLSYFVCCGVSRLARYNVTAETLADGGDKVKYFEGTPIPTSVAIVGLLAWLAWSDRIGTALPFGVLQLGPWQLHPLVLVFALSGSLMISKTLRIPKP